MIRNCHQGPQHNLISEEIIAIACHSSLARKILSQSGHESGHVCSQSEKKEEKMECYRKKIEVTAQLQHKKPPNIFLSYHQKMGKFQYTKEHKSPKLFIVSQNTGRKGHFKVLNYIWELYGATAACRLQNTKIKMMML